MRNGSKKITLMDLAKGAQVSVNTAAKVMAGQAEKARISPKTAEKIRQVAKKIGYVPNIMARNLRSNRTGVIGVFIADMDDWVYARISQVILKILHNQGFSPILTVAEIGHELCMREWVQNRIEGLILCGTTDYMTTAFFAELQRRDILPIIAGCAFKDPKIPHLVKSEVSCVTLDNSIGIQMAIDYLIKRGRKKIAHLAGPPWHADAFERCTTYQQIIALYHKPIVIDYIARDHPWKSGYEQTAKLNGVNVDYDAIITYGDQYALGAIKWLTEHGKQVPNEVAIIGFDNSPESEFCTPSLTTLAQPFEIIGQRSVVLLKENLYSKAPVEKIQIVPELIIRESTS